MSALRDYLNLTLQRRELEEKLERLKSELHNLEYQILTQWADEGQQSASIDGHTIYVARDFYCNKRPEIEVSQVCDTLNALGLTDMIGVNYSAPRLKAYLKETIESGSEVPEELKSMFDYDYVYRLRIRRS